MTLRAIEVLKSVDMVAAEDTRMTSRLLEHFAIRQKLLSVHEHNERVAGEKVLALLRKGQSVALVSDAGTPAVSDPGARLVEMARSEGFRVVPVPGANAAVAALSASGFMNPHFLFYGFLPSKTAARRTELASLKTLPHLLVFYESPHRIMETVSDLKDMLGEDRTILFGRELTKLFEQIHLCGLGEALTWLQADPNHQKGEFVLVVSGHEAVPNQGVSDRAQEILKILLEELPLKQAVQLAAKISGEKKNALYEWALAAKSKSSED